MSLKQSLGKRIFASLLAAGLLVGCASPAGGQHGGHHAAASASTASPGQSGASPAQGEMAGGSTTQSAPCCAMMGGDGAAGHGGMQHKNKEAMCAMYRGMRDAPNEQARQAMMDRHMQSMSPEMRRHHLEAMRQQCQ